MGVREDLGIDLAAGPPARPTTVLCRVVDVTDEGGVNIMYQGALLLDVACSTAYRGRQAGDLVHVRPGVKPLVLYAVGDDPGAATDSSVRDIAREIAVDEDAVTAATWGTGGPSGSGWQTVNTLYVRKDADGKAQLYMQLSSISDTSPVDPGRAPKSKVISPTDSGSWRGGRPDEYASAPTQGDWTGRGNRRGGWFYGTAIAAACMGRTVSGMKVSFTRKRGSGVNGKVPMNLYLHSHTAPPSGQLNLGSGPEDGLLRLSVGAKGTASLPASWRSALASGSARGLAIYASGRSEYASFTGGKITISFSA
ncbi:hypothetical protein DCW30_05920 [Streptomyces alfalfae]|uniref:Minor tail protein n=1 Tax=Streptomyces alfalfae TaxID=1642299 RepID=A0ABN4VKR1_9ACTN|nr:hypothetical protein [Streptomyces alfalfae]APY88166.1 hypothetical protein A7J05_22955 [Streptomyces alfalfae]AYA18559.1 hypothetical protein D3X13_22065 [Streptomyces fradiae]RXX46560.1 hypothetical protein DCW30_05920 [Streptomyces alfalfae]RZM90073.1 hypothetical protein D4104_25855 [Streptomyces alfalfae]